MKVELYYFKGCPTYMETAENLKRALKKLAIKENFALIEVVNAEDAVEKRFLGSPTIKVNGTDLENNDGEFVFGCRIYSIAGKITGTPTEEYILTRLKAFMKT